MTGPAYCWCCGAFDTVRFPLYLYVCAVASLCCALPRDPSSETLFCCCCCRGAATWVSEFKRLADYSGGMLLPKSNIHHARNRNLTIIHTDATTTATKKKRYRFIVRVQFAVFDLAALAPLLISFFSYYHDCRLRSRVFAQFPLCASSVFIAFFFLLLFCAWYKTDRFPFFFVSRSCWGFPSQPHRFDIFWFIAKSTTEEAKTHTQ